MALARRVVWTITHLVLIGVLLAGCQSTASPTSAPAASATTVSASPAPTAAASSGGTPAAQSPTIPPPTAPTTPSASPSAGAAASPTVVSSTAAASPAPSAGPTSPAQASADWPTYGRDATRTGVDPSVSSFTKVQEAWRSDALDGEVYAEPLIVGGRVLVATENNSVYSLDLQTGRQIWRAHLGEPVPRSQLPCGDITTTGITGTPTVDVARGLLYAVTFVQPGKHELVALGLADGAVRFRVPVDPSGSSPLAQQQRAALALAQGKVYVAFGGLFGDCGDYHGWVFAADAASGAVQSTYQVPTQREGGIWAPPGPSIDSAGSVYVATGNGSSTDPSRFDYGDAVLRLSADLRLADWFAPSDWATLNARDADVGSVSPTLLDGGLVFQSGKAGVGYLLRADRLGQTGGEVYHAEVCGGAYGGTAYRAPMLYLSCRDGLVALRVTGKDFSVAWRSSGFFAGPPIVAGGAVWTIARDGTLYALDPSDGHARYQTGVGSVMHFATPSASGGYLVVPAGQQVVVERLG